jgi:hypothetical protein
LPARVESWVAGFKTRSPTRRIFGRGAEPRRNGRPHVGHLVAIVLRTVFALIASYVKSGDASECDFFATRPSQPVAARPFFKIAPACFEMPGCISNEGRVYYLESSSLPRVRNDRTACFGAV